MPHLPATTKFRLGDTITGEQQAFLDHYGFLHFESVASMDEVLRLRSELDAVEERFVREKRQKVFGIPIFYGRRNGRPYPQRFTFTTKSNSPCG